MARRTLFRWWRPGTSTKKGPNGSSLARGNMARSGAAADYFERKKCQVELLPMGAVIPAWNAAEGAVIGLFHVTC